MNRLNWDEGQLGKGLIDDKNNVHTWNQEEYPYHADYLMEHPVRDKTCFYINPSGSVDLSGYADLNDLHNRVNKADSRLYVRQLGQGNKDWAF